MKKNKEPDYISYEHEKKQLQAMNLTPEEYEREIKKLARKYNI